MIANSEEKQTSYYFVKIWINKIANTYGPYLQLGQAVDILLCHSSIALPKKQKRQFSYRAEVQECTQNDDGTWSKIDTHVVENSCILRSQS